MAKQPLFRFYEGELKDILISWLVVSVAFGWVIKNSFSQIMQFPMNIIFAIVVAMIAVGTGFVFHELAHRTVAIRFGAKARYMMWPSLLILALIMAFLTGFVFAAPGAVYIFGEHINRKQNGIISLAGPVTNILLAIMFIAILMAATVFQNDIIGIIAASAASINLFLALFNLLPIAPFDGSKVFAWQPLLWAAIFFPLAAVVFFL